MFEFPTNDGARLEWVVNDMFYDGDIARKKIAKTSHCLLEPTNNITMTNREKRSAARQTQ